MQARLQDQSVRAAAARAVADHPRIVVTCLEAVIGTRYTVDTIGYLRRRCSSARFVWIMGADNLAQFHRWQGFRRIAAQSPFAVIDRPPLSLRALASPAARRWPRAASRKPPPPRSPIASRRPGCFSPA